MEWDSVFIVRFNHGIFPLPQSNRSKIVRLDIERCEQQSLGKSSDSGSSSAAFTNPWQNNHVDEHYNEETRILYVALTRARTLLTLSYVVSSDEDLPSTMRGSPSGYLELIDPHQGTRKKIIDYGSR